MIRYAALCRLISQIPTRNIRADYSEVSFVTEVSEYGVLKERIQIANDLGVPNCRSVFGGNSTVNT